jgi:zinc/manganese transport system permease protein
LLAFALLGAAGMQRLAGSGSTDRWGNDVAIGVVLVGSLGLGLLFLSLSTNYASNVYAILFGAVLAVSSTDLIVIALTCAVVLLVIAVTGRRLLLATVNQELAVAQAVSPATASLVFALTLALTVAMAVQATGVLLVFALLVTPAATARRLTARPGWAIAAGVALAVVCSWLGLMVSYVTPYPPGFFITTFAFGAYVLVRLRDALQRGGG